MSGTETWIVTGSSRGMGRAWVEAALERGHRVVATARDPASLADLAETYGDRVLPTRLDVTVRADVHAVVDDARERFGAVDVVVNNAGDGHDGVIEHLTEEEARRGLETNLLGALWVSQAAARVMRAQGQGRLVQISTQGGHLAHAGLGLYHAAKWGLEGLTESLHHEVSPFGVHTILIEPGAAATEWSTASMTRSEPDPAYETVLAERFAGVDPAALPSARTVVDAAMHAVEADDPPRRLLVTDQAYDNVTRTYRERLDEWAAWEAVARSPA